MLNETIAYTAHLNRSWISSASMCFPYSKGMCFWIVWEDRNSGLRGAYFFGDIFLGKTRLQDIAISSLQ